MYFWCGRVVWWYWWLFLWCTTDRDIYKCSIIGWSWQFWQCLTPCKTAVATFVSFAAMFGKNEPCVGSKSSGQNTWELKG
jgi:hypothetical protein